MLGADAGLDFYLGGKFAESSRNFDGRMGSFLSVRGAVPGFLRGCIEALNIFFNVARALGGRLDGLDFAHNIFVKGGSLHRELLIRGVGFEKDELPIWAIETLITFLKKFQNQVVHRQAPPDRG
jgi:hypothetical protein